jgi:type VI secretion system protein ImpE
MEAKNSMTPYELFQQEKLDEAIELAIAGVKSKPAEIDGRLMLCDLLCMAADWSRVDKQLDVLSRQDPELSVGISLYRHLIRAETARKQFFEQGRLPEFAEDVSEVMQYHLRASIALREGVMSEARDLLEQAEALRRPLSGTCDGDNFSDFRDLDDLTSSFLEVLTSTGKYYWVALEKIETLEFQKPRQLRDLVWRPTSMTIRGGPDAVVYVPVRYYGSHDSDDPAIRVGRGTGWIENPDGPTRGIGQRMFLVNEDDRSIMSIGTIAINDVA